jgi:hypothetical protein
MSSRSSAAATMTLATSPYACAQVSGRSGVYGMPEELLPAQLSIECDVPSART